MTAHKIHSALQLQYYCDYVTKYDKISKTVKTDMTDVSDKFRKTPKSVKDDRAVKIDRISRRMSI